MGFPFLLPVLSHPLPSVMRFRGIPDSVILNGVKR